MAAYDWVHVSDGSMGQDDVLKLAQVGALTLISPARELTLVHAVQQPLAPPVPSGLAVTRSDGRTTAQIDVICQVRWKSTAKLDLWASWSERDGPSNSQVHTYNTHVLEIPVPGGDMLQDDLVSLTIAGSQEFNDTRYRHVQYQMIATSRFAEYFSQDIGPFTQATDPTSTNMRAEVLSTAQPDALKVSYILPAFAWLFPVPTSGNPTKISVTRLGGGLRVYLGPNWYLSGDGEMLAVVVSPGTTQTGQDPTSATNPAGGTVSLFDADGEPAEAIDVADGSIVPYAVEFDAARGLWFADIHFATGAEYFPFVALVLARYQPSTLADLPNLSPPVSAGIAQLAPDRFVTLLAAPPQDPTQPDAVIQLQIQVSAQQPGSTASVTSDAAGTTIEVVLQEQTVPGSDDELGWETTGQLAQPVADPGPPTPPFLWTGTTAFPFSLPSGKYRLVVREFDAGAPAGADPFRIVFAFTILLDDIVIAVS
jgi:hypothetical protein